jgi:hypothetical protein
MAFVTRTGKLSVNVSKYLRPVFSQRCISTSKKNEETATVTEKLPSHSAEHSEINNVAATVAKKVCIKTKIQYDKSNKTRISYNIKLYSFVEVDVPWL